MGLFKRHGMKTKAQYQLGKMIGNNYSRSKSIKYSTRFEDILKPLNCRLVELEQNLNSINEHPEKQKVVLEILTEIRNTKEEIHRHETNLQCSKNMQAVRSQKTPTIIADHDVWNDCWYDEKRKAYVTFNQGFEKFSNARTRSIQVQYEKETDSSNSGIVVEDEKIQFMYGYPAILIKDQDGNPVWYLMPTMTDEMLTKEIVKARLRPGSYKESVIYETESEQWITIGTKGLSLCEKENEISDELLLYPPVPLEELKKLYNRK